MGQVAKVQRESKILKTGKTRTETAYIVTSLTPDKADPERLLGLVRSYWSIENRSHWVRDCVFDEDRCQIRTGNGPCVMATLRNTAIGLLRLAGATNIAAALRDIAAQPHLAAELIDM